MGWAQPSAVIKALRQRLAGVTCAVFLLVAPALAQNTPSGSVTYLTDSGDTVIAGRLLSHDSGFARIQTPSGSVTLSIDGLRCDGPGCPAPGTSAATLRIAGAPEIARLLMPALLERYALSGGYTLSQGTPEGGPIRFELTRDTETLIVTLLPLAHDAAMAAQADGAVDLVMALRPPAGLSARRIRVLALDGLVPVVARDNPLSQITMAQLRGILTGQITDWGTLGYPAGGAIDIRAVADTAQVGGLLPPAPAPTQTSTDAARPAADQVAAAPGGFALLRASEVRLARALAITGPCGRPIAATPARLKAEDYPLAAPFLLILPPGRMNAQAPAFLRFLNTPAAQRVVRRSGFVDQLPERIPLNAQGQRLANAVIAAGGTGAPRLADLQALVDGLRGTERLTLSFRFDGGGSGLDAQSTGNVDHLARLITSGRLEGKTVIFAGFGDGSGPAEANRTLSLARAEAVRDAVLAAMGGLSAGANPPQTEVQGHGEALPMACDDSAWGRQVNRRVEIWLR